MKSIYKYVLVSVFVWMLSLPVFGQINVIIRQPVAWHFTLDQIWNADVVNSGSAPVAAFLDVSVSNANGVLLVQGKSGEVSLSQGINLLTLSRIPVPEYIFSNQADMHVRSGVFPYGKYSISMKLYDKNHMEIGIGSLEAFEVNVLSPPLLFTPSNESEVPVPYPLLSWSPPSPVIASVTITYDLRLVEIMHGQTSNDALRRNYAILDMRDIPVCFFQYPASAMPLENGKKYAWQVVARSGGYLIGETEVWTFTYNKPVTVESKDPVVYSKVKHMRDGAYCSLINGKLYFQFEEQYIPSASVIRFEIFDGNRGNVSGKCNQKLIKQTGDNRFEIDLARCSSFKKGYYFLEVQNEKNDKFYLTFKVE